MNTQSFERQLQQIDPPPPDSAARLRARRAALEEFDRVKALRGQRHSWRAPRVWLGGFAAAGVAIVGASLYWLMPASERVVAFRPVVPVQARTSARPPAVPDQSPPPPAEVTAAKQRPAPRLPPRRNVAAPAAPSAAGAPIAEISARASNPTAPQQPPTSAITAPAAVAAVPPAPPRGDEDELAEAQVTGTRILAPPGTSAPTEAGVVPAGGPPRGSNFIGNTIANLRGLDPTFGSRTLTLSDGRRVVSASNQADVNSAPYGAAQPQANDKFEQFAINPVKRTADEPVSTFSIDVDTASYSFVRRQLNEGAPPPAGAVRTEEMINYFDYDWPAADSRELPFKPTVTVSDSPWGTGKKLVHIGIKGYELPARQRPDVNLVLLLDVSGSMNEPDKLPLAQRSMAMLLDNLKPTDTVGIAVYAGAAGEVLPPTPARDRDVILRALYSLRPGGSTAGAAGIRLAYDMAARSFRKEGVNRILLATDGDFNVGISDARQLQHFVEQQRERGIFLSVLGFGEDNYRDDIAQALAQNGNGVAAYIDTLNEAHKVLVEQAGSQLFTIAKDVKLQVEFNPATVAEYRLVGYETRALAREDFNNDKVDAGDVGAGHTVTAIYEITPVDSAARLVDGLRYGGEEKKQAPDAGNADEYGYLKIRYKLPGSDTSQLIEQPIAVRTGVPRAVRRDVAFSTAVAGFAQLLQGGKYTGPLTYDDVYRQAKDALGEDPRGYRAEFLQLVRRAQGMLGQR